MDKKLFVCIIEAKGKTKKCVLIGTNEDEVKANAKIQACWEFLLFENDVIPPSKINVSVSEVKQYDE